MPASSFTCFQVLVKFVIVCLTVMACPSSQFGHTQMYVCLWQLSGHVVWYWAVVMMLWACSMLLKFSLPTWILIQICQFVISSSAIIFNRWIIGSWARLKWYPALLLAECQVSVRSGIVDVIYPKSGISVMKKHAFVLNNSSVVREIPGAVFPGRYFPGNTALSNTLKVGNTGKYK